MFQIYEIRPVHCQITDAMIGSRAIPLPMTYRSERLAAKLASRIEQQHYDNCGDSSYRVVPYGESPYFNMFARPPTWNNAPAAFADDMPF